MRSFTRSIGAAAVFEAMATQPERVKFSAKLNFFDDMLRNQLRNDLNKILLKKVQISRAENPKIKA